MRRRAESSAGASSPATSVKKKKSFQPSRFAGISLVRLLRLPFPRPLARAVVSSRRPVRRGRAALVRATLHRSASASGLRRVACRPLERAPHERRRAGLCSAKAATERVTGLERLAGLQCSRMRVFEEGGDRPAILSLLRRFGNGDAEWPSANASSAIATTSAAPRRSWRHRAAVSQRLAEVEPAERASHASTATRAAGEKSGRTRAAWSAKSPLAERARGPAARAVRRCVARQRVSRGAKVTSVTPTIRAGTNSKSPPYADSLREARPAS